MNSSDINLESFRYDKMVEKALRDVVKQALKEVIDKGLVADHHFYITFLTKTPGVKIPDYLKEKYPSEMTIVLQHQFYDLKVDDEKFSVMLSFNNIPENLVIPLEAITIFADPSVNFALQFQAVDEFEDDDFEGDFDEQKIEKEAVAEKAEEKGEVISLDTFRKKDDKDEKPKKKSKPKAKSKKKDKEEDKED